MQSHHHPAQVQPRSLLYYLSHVPNNVRPLTALKKNCILRARNAQLYATMPKKERGAQGRSVATNVAGTGMMWLCCKLYLHAVFPISAIPVSIFAPPMEIRHQ